MLGQQRCPRTAMGCSTTTATRKKSWASDRGTLALIFGTAPNKFQDPAKLRCVGSAPVGAAARAQLDELYWERINSPHVRTT
jgi:hypothetical protein